MDTIVGQIIDNYKIIDVLGRGGMGVVFKALDLNLDKLVALKMIDPFLARDENFLRRFKLEAKALAKLEDRNIVSVFALRETEYGLFMVMEYVKAKTVSEWIHEKEKFSVQDTISITKQLLHAIDCAHNAGIIHRDIKPNNILLGEDGSVKVMDFGLAKLLQDKGSTNTVTQTAAGTLYYMSPEQIKGLQNVDQRSDIYSIGITVYEILTGRTPFEKTDSEFEIQKQIVEGRIAPPSRYNPGIPKQLIKFIMKAVDKDVNKRFQNIPEMQSALSLVGFNDEGADEKTKVIIPSGIREKPGTISPFKLRLMMAVTGIIIIGLILLFVYYPGKYSAQKVKPVIVQNQPVRDRVILTSKLSITSTPAGALVFINGKSVGKTPYILDSLQTGKISVMLKKKGFDEWSNPDFDVRPGSNLIDSKLIPAEKKEVPAAVMANSALILKMDLPGKILIDNEESNSNTNEFVKNNLTSGKHTVIFQNPKFGSKQTTISLNENQKKELTCYFMHRVSIQSLNMAGETFWGTIYINGENTGKTTPGDISLPPGSYKISVKKAGYSTVEKDIILNIQPAFELNDQSFVFHLQ